MTASHIRAARLPERGFVSTRSVNDPQRSECPDRSFCLMRCPVQHCHAQAWSGPKLGNKFLSSPNAVF